MREEGRERFYVFPAHAGMFLMRGKNVRWLYRFPRARGDVPQGRYHHSWRVAVFPAHAGMFRLHIDDLEAWVRFPRARGDVPNYIKPAWDALGFSPRTRGCSWVYRKERGTKSVFPAHAGMFRL